MSEKQKTKTAKELFEELGYNLVFDNGSMLEYYNKNNDKVINFQVYNKYYRGDLFGEDTPHCITPELHKAVHQQLIEFGWI